MSSRMRIRVPGSTSNLGPGFDSIGLAVDRFLELDLVPADEWRFFGQTHELQDLPSGKDNFIFEIAHAVAHAYGVHLDQYPHHVSVYSDIPLARGLGSSASAIVAAIELANNIGNLQLTIEEKLRVASLREGHIDNVAASLYGGLIVGSHREDATELVQIDLHEVAFVAIIPAYELQTAASRKSLVPSYDRYEAVKASAIANTLVAALCTKNWVLAGKMMEKDHFHEQARAHLVPELNQARSWAKDYGAYGTFLSGAGPTVFIMTDSNQAHALCEKATQQFPEAECAIIRPSSYGVQVYTGAETPRYQQSIK
ncbi:homoserine kinase [Bacillaceae bacterium SIJ1]|uniref:homoserine kinase n=1 Tax=Litoribacterium kuwaitense TaxID=1398745 RepID=UPI0013EB5CF0|nr:homoserine kinase [Litoribacterium kuwaitense]NGP46634.1 homoserine kinase [Litoribacterium kuwaitense]